MRLSLTLGRYFGMRFLVTVLAVFGGVIFLVALLDSVELKVLSTVQHLVNQAAAVGTMIRRPDFFIRKSDYIGLRGGQHAAVCFCSDAEG